MTRKQYSSQFKAKVVVEAIRGVRPVNELAARFGVRPVQIAHWKKQALAGIPGIFTDRRGNQSRGEESLTEELYEQIGRLKMDLEWLKNSPDLPIERRRLLIDREEEKLSVRRQCELLGVGRSGLYYCAAGENAEKVALMRKLDEQYTRTPYYGVRRMTAWLQREGWEVNPKRVRRLLRVMGLEAIYPKPKLSQPEEGRRVYPYLLRDVAIERVDHVWSSDNTYIRMARQLVISGGGDRLVQPVRVELATGGESGERFLCGGAGRRLAAQPQPPAADFQHGPGLAVHQ